ncbi:MAG: SAM-dependent methyltransferase [Promethearchaeota archaeon]|nr:MAG: SAM-dependent methyltransferase [Candidatus Lokiarchaeota archaeon]
MNDKYTFNVKTERPEEKYESVIDYFKGKRLDEYALSKNMQRIQTRIAARALEILDLQDTNSLILDAGCGPGFASFYLKELGFKVVAFDLIGQFLTYYDLTNINPLVADMVNPPFKARTFDGIISISALQWIYRNIENESMERNFIILIKSFHKVLKFGSKIVFQFYPKSDHVLDKIGEIISRETPFQGGFIIDNPESPKKRRIFLELIKGDEI